MDADSEYIRILRAMTPERKLRTAEGLCDSARAPKADVPRADPLDWRQLLGGITYSSTARKWHTLPLTTNRCHTVCA